jgi:hypothetical protein
VKELLTILLSVATVQAQVGKVNPRAHYLVQKLQPADAILDSESRQSIDALEKQLREGTTNVIAQLAGSSIFLSLPGFEGSIVSANQARVIVQEFFGRRAMRGFEFTQRGLSNGNPFATGRMTAVFRGEMESYQVYVAFTRVDRRIILSQLNIY